MISRLSEEQKEYFKKCPYVVNVNDYYICFSNEFKDEFLSKYKAGLKPRKIIDEMGIDINMLTIGRLNGLRGKLLMQDKLNDGQVIKETNKRHSEHSQSHLNSFDILEKNFKNAVKKIAELESIINYKDQEIKYLKKIIFTGTRKEHSCSET